MERPTDNEIAEAGESMTLAGADAPTPSTAMSDEEAAWRRSDRRQTALAFAVQTAGKKPKTEDVVARAAAYLAFIEG